ncbi:MAG: methyl-accepting chemotaxis protein [Pseudomonadota bacterium]
MHTEEELETAIKSLRRGRGLAVNAGAIGITLATAQDPNERAEMAEYLKGFIARFCEVVKELATLPIMREAGRQNRGLLDEIQGFAGEMADLDAEDDYAALTRDRATAHTTRAREKTLPAFYTFIRAFEAERAGFEARRTRQMQDQAVQLEKMFGEVEDIGRMIHLISLNASVEAARAGGESGRSFKVIADEIRGLAAKSAQLIDSTRETMRTGSGCDHG